MKKIIIISGPMGVGKTTTGIALCDKIGKTAFIDGDWCLDIHPFVGNKETKDMAIKNIVYLVKNYYYCSECENIVLSWVISEKRIENIISELKDIELRIFSITLTCNEEELLKRWKNDKTVDWRTDEWYKESIKSLEDYNNRKNTIIIETNKKQIEMVVNEIIKKIK